MQFSYVMAYSLGIFSIIKAHNSILNFHPYGKKQFGEGIVVLNLLFSYQVSDILMHYYWLTELRINMYLMSI